MIKLNTKYEPLVYGRQRYNIISGGRASGKSFSIATYLLGLTFEVGNVILFSRWTMTSINISVYPEFLEKIEILNISHLFEITKNEIINTETGSKIIFKGIKTGSSIQTANLKSIAGLNIVVIDEAEEVPDEGTFDKIDLSARRTDKDNKIILIFNPTSKVHWIYKRFFESVGVQPGQCISTDDTNYIHSTYLDNKKYLSESIIKQIEKIKNNNPDKYEHILMGAFLDVAEGVIFKNWEIGEFNNDLEYGFGQDFGFSPDPDTLTKVAIDKKNKIIYLDECIYDNKLTTPDLISRVKHYVGNKQIVADNSSNRLIDELRRGGLNVMPCTKGAGSVEVGIKLLMDYKLVVTNTSLNLIKELNNYVWNDRKAGQPKDMYNHCFIGETLVTTNKGYLPIKDINIGDFVLTRDGYKHVLKRWDNGKKTINKYKIEFDTFNIYISSTPEHKIKTNVGWVQISQLKSGMMAILDKNLMGKYINYTQDIIISQEVIEECTQSCGNFLMVNNRKDTTFTTSMKIPGIIESKTLNSLNLINTYPNTVNKDLLITQIGQKNFIERELKAQKNGINQKKDYNGIENTQRDLIGERQTMEQENVRLVKKNIKKEIKHKDFVEITVKQNIEDFQELIMKKEFVSVEENSQSINIQSKIIVDVSVVKQSDELVYDLMVEDKHEYFANGLLVHNCIDGLRYYVSHILKIPTDSGKIYRFDF